MNLRLVGIKPLVGVDLQHTASGANPNPIEVSERCDSCGKEVSAGNIYFDGERFLCAACSRIHALEHRE